MYLVQVYLVTMEKPMGYTTRENALDQQEMPAMCTMCKCSGSKILTNEEIC